MPKKNPILFENRIFYMFSFYISTLTKYYIFLILALAIIPFCNSHLYKRVIALRHKVNGDISEEFFHCFYKLIDYISIDCFNFMQNYKKVSIKKNNL